MDVATFKIETRDWLRATMAAHRLGISRSEFVRRAVLAELNRQKPGAA